MFTITVGTIANLKEEATKASNRRARLILHKEGDPFTESLILLRADSYVRCHRHPAPECYHLCEGDLLVSFPGEGRIVRLTRESPVLRIEAGTWHQPMPAGDYAIYHEIYGPFVKERDVEYAAWAREE